MNKEFVSKAQWPVGTAEWCNNITSDEHYTKEEAIGVCRLLERDGFGGERKIFPIKTWVENIEE